MLDKNEIKDAFRMLNLLDAKNRQRLLSLGLVTAETEEEMHRIVLDNVTKSNELEGSKDAELE